MKRSFIILIASALIIGAIGCRGYLEKPPGVDITEDVIFSSMTQAETFVAGTYLVSIPLGYPMTPATERRLNGSILAACCDEGEAAELWANSQRWNSGAVPNNNIIWDEDERVNVRWQAIRKCNILLERIDGVPGATPAFINQVKGEALFLRALLYFETVKRYGGVAIITKRQNPDDDVLLPRNSIEECFNFIVKDCNEALELLPASQPLNMRGRATKGSALALKSRALLYAASPLFNTASPYISLGENNKMICYTNYDKNRWQKAADASKATLDWAAANDCYLVTKYGIDRNYEMMWTEPDNNEIILANKEYGGFGRGRPFQAIMPNWAGSSYGDGGLSVPFNFVMMYEKKDGTKQTWNMAGGNDLVKKYSELDPRFRQTITAHGDTWNNAVGKLNLSAAPHATNCRGGHWMRKTIPRDLLPTGTATIVINWIVFRLGEVYLNYAEALNEANGPTSDAYNAVNIVRARSGMPALPTGLSQDQFRERVRNERTIELSFEEHRFWDIRRWLIADQEGVMKGDFYGLTITPLPGSSGEASYKPVVFERRVWNPQNYLHPFPSGEIFKGYLVQNPGW